MCAEKQERQIETKANAARSAYVSPVLKTFGQIGALTQSGTQLMAEGPGAGNMDRTPQP